MESNYKKRIKYRIRPSKKQKVLEVLEERKKLSTLQIRRLISYVDLLTYPRWLKYLTVDEIDEFLMDEDCEEITIEGRD